MTSPGTTKVQRTGVVLLSSLSVAGVLAGVALLTSAFGGGSDAMRSPHQAQPAAGHPLHTSVESSALPAVAYGVTPEVAKALGLQGVRIDGRGDGARATTTAAQVFSQPGDVRPDSIALVRVTDTQLGQLVGPDGKPLDQPGPGSAATVVPRIDHRLVWIAVYRDATIPVGGSYVETLGGTGPAAGLAGDAPPTTVTTDLYVIRDASSGAVLSGGSLNETP